MSDGGWRFTYPNKTPKPKKIRQGPSIESCPALRKGQKRKGQRSKIPGDTKAKVDVRDLGVEPATVSRT